MIIKLLKNQPLAPKKNFFHLDKLSLEVFKLSLTDRHIGYGDCIEVDSNPNGIYQYTYSRGANIFIRQINDNLWRIWRIK